MFERFTDRARRVLVLAQEEARLLNHNFIGTEHMLLGLIQEGDGVGARTIEFFNITLDDVRQSVRATVGSGTTLPSGSPPFTPRAKQVLELSLREALQLGHNYIGTEHLLLGLLREGEGVAAQVLTGFGLDLAGVRHQVLFLLGSSQGSSVEAPPGIRAYVFGGCSFCGRRAEDAGRLISGRGMARICAACVASMTERFAAGPESDEDEPDADQPDGDTAEAPEPPAG
ncbi:MAG: Clp protease N-terminal domain-containing protein [Acidimicrobiales bacterium]